MPQKNKWFTLAFSLFFGAGQMYLGYMKRGLFLMLLLAAIIFTKWIFHTSFFSLLIPILWAYSFFDAFHLSHSQNNSPTHSFHFSYNFSAIRQNICNVLKSKNSFQKNRCLTFLFALCFGCGQMYLGYMKRGISLMLILAFNLFAANFLHLPALLYFSFIIGAYSFFDTYHLIETPHQLDTFLLPFSYLKSLARYFFAKECLLLRIWVLFLFSFYFMMHQLSNVLSNTSVRFSENTIVYIILYSLPIFILSCFFIYYTIQLTRKTKHNSSVSSAYAPHQLFDAQENLSNTETNSCSVPTVSVENTSPHEIAPNAETS